MSNTNNNIIAGIAEALTDPIEGIAPAGHRDGRTGIWLTMPKDVVGADIKRELDESKLAIDDVNEATVNEESRCFHVKVISASGTIEESHRCPVCQTPAPDDEEGIIACEACSNVFSTKEAMGNE